MILAMLTIVCISFLWTHYNNPGIRKLAGVKQLLRNAADEMTLVLTDVESTQALSQWNSAVSAFALNRPWLCIAIFGGFVFRGYHDFGLQRCFVSFSSFLYPLLWPLMQP